MTLRGAGMFVLGGGLIMLGWMTGWPELTALGTGGVVLVVSAIALAGLRPRAEIALDRTSLRVVRGESASARLTILTGRRRRWMRVVEGAVSSPRCSVGLPSTQRGDDVALTIPLDTSRRGEHPVGPYSVVHGDPWSIVRRILNRTEAGTVTVLPRTFPVGRRLLASASVEDSNLSSTRPGEHHFHALRDYVLGDEPRIVHWRSSARVGHLVVRQQIAAATSGTAIVLDCDVTAYGPDEQFGVDWVGDRFEAAVEVAASVVVADAGRKERVHLVRTIRHAALVSTTASSSSGCLDVLAMVQPAAPVETDSAGLLRILRRTRCARVVVVTGTPRPALVDAARRIRRAGMPTVMVRVGAKERGSLDGILVVDVDEPSDLADARA